MKTVALPAKTKIIRSFALLLLLAAAGLGVLGYALLGPVDIALADRPNAVEAQEAARKLKLLNDALAGKRQGFVRLSEAEINSFLETRYNKPGQKNAAAPAGFLRTGVLLHANEICFVTWHKLPLLGREFTVVWQRTIVPRRTADGWELAMTGMRVGKLAIPRDFWPDIKTQLGAADRLFEERKLWLAGIPTVMLSRNEVSRAPELRLYSYLPVVRPENDSLEPVENESTSTTRETDTLTAKLSL